ncbi:hypothetical protein LJC14_02960 [Treponema sp. OttesenSCG-928-L16]|nr:hypothetical protein [Treponema sp. OttesenSCG-928-L16]
MVWLGIKKLAKQLGLQEAGPEAAGVTGNLFIKLADRTGMKTLEIVFPEFSEEDQEALAALFKEQKIKEYTFGEKNVSLIFREQFVPYSIKKINEHIDAVKEYFERTYPGTKQKCQHCNELKEAQVYYTKDGSLYLCEKCFYNCERDIQEEERQRSYEPNNYLRGFIGAFLFSIPGILVTILFFNVLETIAAVSAIVYILLARTGYKKFGGKQNIAGSIIVNTTGILMTVAGIVVSYTILIYTVAESLDLVWEVYKFPEVQEELLRNILVALIVSLIYVVINAVRMSKEWSGIKIKKGRELR